MSLGETRRTFVFGPFELDPSQRLLERRGEPVSLTPKALETLCLLVERRGELVTREELLTTVWPDLAVEEAVLSQNVYTLRKLLGGETGGPLIETVPRRGYRFAATVEVRRRDPGPIEGLGILRFTAIGEGEEAAVLGEAIADLLASRLGKLGRLTVRVASLPAGGGPREAVHTGQRLGVEAIVDGTVLQAGDRLRLTARLTSVASGARVWTESFDIAVTDLLDMQDAIAERLAKALRLELTAGERRTLTQRGTVDPDAYRAYAKGRFFWSRRTAVGLRRAADSYAEAIRIDPGYALAHAGLADAYSVMPLFGDVSPREAHPRAKAEARRALELDPRSAEAHSSMAYSRFIFDWDWKRAEEAFAEAIALDPGYATARQWYAYLLASRDRHHEAREQARAALRAEPLSLVINADLGFVLYFGRRFDEAGEHFLEALELDPSFAYGHFGLSLVEAARGRIDEAVSEARKAVTLAPESSLMRAGMGYGLALAGDVEEARAVVRSLESVPAGMYVPAGCVGLVQLGLGDAGAALEAWRRAVEERSRFVLFFRVWPVFDPLRDDPRFGNLARRVL